MDGVRTVGLDQRAADTGPTTAPLVPIAAIVVPGTRTHIIHITLIILTRRIATIRTTLTTRTIPILLTRITHRRQTHHPRRHRRCRFPRETVGFLS